MKYRQKYAIVTTYDNAEVELGTIIKIVGNDAFMQKGRILKRVETLHPKILMSLDCNTQVRTGTVKKVIWVLDALYRIYAGDHIKYNIDGIARHLEEIREDLSCCSQAVEEIEIAIEDFEHYCEDTIGHYLSGEYFLKHVGSALLWSFGLKGALIHTRKSFEMQPA